MQFWIQLKRRFSTIGTNLSWTMFGLVVFTVTAALIVVVSFIGWYYDLLLDHASQILAKQYNISDTNQQKLLEEANIRAERDLSLAVLSPTEQWVLLTLIGLTLLLPSLLAWWLSSRFARPLTNLSKAAHQITSGDFTARVHLSSALEQRQDEAALLLKDFNSMAQSLERLERERRYGLAAIAHELRTPVTVLRGRLEGVRDGVLEPDQAEIEKLLGHADLLTKLIADLQLLSLAEAGELPLEQHEFKLQNLLTRVHTDFLGKAEASGIHFMLEPANTPFTFVADEQRLYQVLSNLLSNALRHTPKGGTITLRAKIEKHLILEVQDTGAGLSPEAQKRAFERFYRSADRNKSNGGTGLGLSISRSLIQAHNGTLKLIPSTRGAYFQIKLPLQSQKP